MARRPSPHDLITSRKVPKSIGPHPHAVRVQHPGTSLFVSAQLPLESPAGRPFTGDIRRQAELALGHVRNILQDAGFTMDEMVRCTLYLTDLANLDKVDAIYQRMFVGQTQPARTVVQVAALQKDAGLAVDCIAMKRGISPEELLDEEGEMM